MVRRLLTPTAAIVLLALLVADAVFLLPRETVVGGIVSRAVRGRMHVHIFIPEAWIYQDGAEWTFLDPYGEASGGGQLNADEAWGFAQLHCREQRRGLWAATQVVTPLKLTMQQNGVGEIPVTSELRDKFADFLAADEFAGWRELAEPVRAGVTEQRRTLPLGYLHNAAAAIVFVAFLWSLCAIPGSFRAAIGEDRLMRGLCPRCRYSVRGLVGHCPECGAGLPAASATLPAS